MKKQSKINEQFSQTPVSGSFDSESMTDEQLDFEFQQAQTFSGFGSKNAGQLVETKSGLIGRTYNNEKLVCGKIKVFTEKGNLLCDPNTLKLKGFID